MGDDATTKKRLGPYKILGELGRGGMGSVRRGIHEILKREVAIKELTATAAKDKDAPERFRREGLALAQLRHQNIVAIHDFFVSRERMFMVLEYVEGHTVAALLREGPTPIKVAAIIGSRLASALDHAHYRRLIHRDIKPSNVMISRVGEIKLMDFGIARDQTLTGLTETGMAVGTPFYMAPEQLLGDIADSRADLFALGVLLYECLTGVRPFDGKSPEEVYRSIRDGRYVPVRHRRPEVPGAIARAVEKGIRARPKDRYQAANDLRRDLDRYLDAHVGSSLTAHVVEYLHDIGKITASEAKTCMDAAPLVLTSRMDHAASPPKRSAWRVVAWLAILAACGGAVWTYFARPWWWSALLGTR